MKTLRPYQEKTLEILAEGGINASGLGAGKTLTSVEAVRRLNLGRVPRVLVITPNGVRRHWLATFAEQFPSLEKNGLARIVGSHQSDLESWVLMTKKRPGVYIMGWQAMHGAVLNETRRKVSRGRNAQKKKPDVTITGVRQAIKEGTVPPWTRTGTWDLVIIDESHRATNVKGAPFNVLKVIKTDKHLALSATPARNKPHGLWSTLNLIWPEKYNNYWHWVRKYFEVKDQWISRDTTVPQIGEELHPGALWKDIPAVVRYRTEEMVKDMPSVIERRHEVSMDPGQAEQYYDFAQEGLAWLGEMPVGTVLDIERRIRLRQAALGTLTSKETTKRVKEEILTKDLDFYFKKREGASPAIVRQYGEITLVSRLVPAVDVFYDPAEPQPKLDAVKDIIADLPDDEPVLIWCSASKWIRMAEKKLGSKAVGWTTSTTAKKRERIESEFGTTWRILLAQTQSLGEGVDWLKDCCRCEIIVADTEEVVINQQAEGRLYRPGQKFPVQRWRVITPGTIDEVVEEANLAKHLQLAVMYGDRRKKADAA